jgi:hypothetical protein
VPEYFNPYHQWLGLGDRTSNPAPHQLLGLSRGETNVATIQRAAEQARGRVLAHSPGPHVAQWTRLLTEIEAAKNSLLAGARARVPMQAPSAAVPMPSGGQHRPAPRPKAPEAGIPVAAPVAASVPGSTAAPFSASRRTKHPVKARRAKRSSNLVPLSWMFGGLMLLAAVVLPLTVALKTRDTARNRSTRVQVAAPPTHTPLPGPSPTAETSPKQRRPVRTETSSGRMSPTVQPGEEPPDVAEPKEQEELVPIEPTQIQPLSHALADARQALERDRFEEALTRLSAVQNLPMSDEDLHRYQRLQLLVQYARHFHDELSNSLQDLQGGDEIPVGTSNVVGVVEADANRITVRIAGANRTYQREALPTGLAIAIVDLRLDDSDPISLVLKAAHLASRQDARDDQLQKARDWFRQAKQQGADIGDLEKVLDDTYLPSP